LLAVLGLHFAPLRQQLIARGQMLRSFTLVLRSEDAPCRIEKLEPAQPTADPTVFLDLARLRLAGQPLRGKVESIEIEIEGSAGTGQQAELFASLAPRDLEAAERALARLRAEFGEDAVLGARIEEGHLPEARVRWRRFEGLQEPRPRAVHERPLVRRRFDRPRALPSGRRRQDPDGWMILGLEGGAVEEVVGPFVVRGGWWLREVHREYHYVRTVRRGWVWVYYDRRRRRWYQQGTVQ
jgi:protein ImuB